MRRGALVAVGLVVVVAAGCRRDECAAIYARQVECSGRSDLPPERMFVSACEMAKEAVDTRGEYAVMAACVKRATCAEFVACSEGQRGARRAGEIAQQAATGQWRDALDGCTLSAAYFTDPAFAAACEPVFAAMAERTGADADAALLRCQSSGAIARVAPALATGCAALAASSLTAARAAVTAARDAGRADAAACAALEQRAAQAGGAHPAEAAAACREAALAEDAQAAIADARTAIARRRTGPVAACEDALERLGVEPTPWATARHAEVAQVCVGELGVVVIEVEAATARPGQCPPRIAAVQRDVAALGLAGRYPALDRALDQAPAACRDL